MNYFIIFGCLILALFLRFKKFGQYQVHRWSQTYEQRKLGLLERWYASSQISGTLYNYGYVIEAEGKPPSALELTSVLKTLVRKHASLRYYIKFDRATPEPELFVPISALDSKLAKAIYFQDRVTGDSWKSIILKEHQTPLPEDGSQPLFRIVVISKDSSMSQPFEIIVVFQHALVDGTSGAYFCRDLMQSIAQLRIHNSISEPPMQPLTPPMDNFIDLRPSIWDLMKTLFEIYVKPLYSSKATHWTGPPQTLPVTERRVAAQKFFVLEEKDTIALLRRCREENTTINAAIMSAAHFGLSRAIQNQEFDISSMCAINMRPFLIKPAKDAWKVPNTLMGPFVAGSKVGFHLRPQSKFWDLARETRKKVTDRIVPAYQTIGMIEFVKNKLTAFLKEETTHGCTMSTHFTNLGRLEMDYEESKSPESQLKLKEFWISLVRPHEGAVFILSIATVNDRMTIAVGYPTTIDESLVSAFVSGTKAALSACVKGQVILNDFVALKE